MIPGSRVVTHATLGGSHIYWVQRSGLGYKETASFTVGNQEFRKTGITITFEHPSSGTASTSSGPVVLVGEKVWVLYET